MRLIAREGDRRRGAVGERAFGALALLLIELAAFGVSGGKFAQFRLRKMVDLMREQSGNRTLHRIRSRYDRVLLLN